MSNTATVPAPAPVSVSDMTTAQLSERMSKLAERHDALKASVSEYDTVKADLTTTLAEIQKRLGPVAPTAAPAKPKAKAKVKPTTPKAPKADGGGRKFPALKQIVLGILGNNPAGLDLNGIRVEVQAMIDRKEYHSNAENLSAVISQAVNALKTEGSISRDDESKKYSKKAA